MCLKGVHAFPGECLSKSECLHASVNVCASKYEHKTGNTKTASAYKDAYRYMHVRA